MIKNREEPPLNINHTLEMTQAATAFIAYSPMLVQENGNIPIK